MYTCVCGVCVYVCVYVHKSCADAPVHCSGGVGAPVVNECEGEYTHDPRKHTLQWHLPVIDSTNPNGSMEFTIAGIPDDFFPVRVSFVSNTTFCQIKVHCVCVCVCVSYGTVSHICNASPFTLPTHVRSPLSCAICSPLIAAHSLLMLLQRVHPISAHTLHTHTPIHSPTLQDGCTQPVCVM